MFQHLRGYVVFLKYLLYFGLRGTTPSFNTISVGPSLCVTNLLFLFPCLPAYLCSVHLYTNKYAFLIGWSLANQRVSLELVVADYDRIGSSDPIGRVECGYNRKGENYWWLLNQTASAHISNFICFHFKNYETYNRSVRVLFLNKYLSSNI